MNGLLFPNLAAPPVPAGIDLRCCGVDEILAEAHGVTLVHADPPWRYAREAGVANPEENGIYDGLSEPEIAAHLDASWSCCAPSARLACWFTWPKEEEWRAAGQAGPRWGARKSGGAWTKAGSFGVGYHWRGFTEPVALFTKGSTGRCREALLNGHVCPPGQHSEKPIQWLCEWVRAWTDPGDLVLDLYAGMAPMARACAMTGRRYLGAEIDPERHDAAINRLALWRREMAA